MRFYLCLRAHEKDGRLMRSGWIQRDLWLLSHSAPEWRNGRRRGLKIPRSYGHEGSTPSSGTSAFLANPHKPSLKSSVFALRRARLCCGKEGSQGSEHGRRHGHGSKSNSVLYLLNPPLGRAVNPAKGQRAQRFRAPAAAAERVLVSSGYQGVGRGVGLNFFRAVRKSVLSKRSAKASFVALDRASR
jgi:hypothetical protein